MATWRHRTDKPMRTMRPGNPHDALWAEMVADAQRRLKEEAEIKPSPAQESAPAAPCSDQSESRNGGLP